MDKFLRWGGVAMLAVGLGLAIFSVGCSGMDVGDWVHGRAPSNAARLYEKSTGMPVPSRMSYNDLVDFEAEYLLFAQQEIEKLQKGYDDIRGERESTAELVGLFSAMGEDTLAQALPFVNTLPGGSMLAPFLTAAGAWFARSKVSVKKDQQEKDSLYDEAYERGKAAGAGEAKTSDPMGILVASMLANNMPGTRNGPASGN